MSRSPVTKIVRSRVLAVLAGLALSGGILTSPAAADPLGAGNGTIYRMGGDSAFHEGCFPPCLCPLLTTAPVRGTLKLIYQGQFDGLHTYDVADINWLVPGDEPGLRIVGSGRYLIGSPSPLPVIQQRMILDLRVGDDPTQRFDSGWVARESNANIRIDVSINNAFCWDRLIEIDAMRVAEEDIRRYRLVFGSTYQHGCFDPCDCLLEEERPLVGHFALVSLGDTALFQMFAVVDVKWAVMSPAVNATIPIRGYGIYRLGGTAAIGQRMILDLIVGGEPRARFDSGNVPGEAIFPKIDIVVSKHGMVCLDTVLHIVAEPVEGRVCGGFAGLPCDDDEFCKLPVGHCCCDFFGVCTPLPDACPEIWDPVCGCDGQTYGNECEADAAGVSIDHWGECRTPCGGADNDAACPDGQFCKFPTGSCGEDGDVGLCTPMPDSCPLVWAPVCGCDGATYGNECESDSAGVSVRHPGECLTDDCAATRFLDDPDLSYCPGVPKAVRIVLSPPSGTTAISVEDAPPPGWTVSDISHDGWFDDLNRKVKWGPFFAPFPESLEYVVTPSSANADAAAPCFMGSISLDGINQAICGDRCVEQQCCPLIPADLPQSECSACPVGDCTSCSDDTCQDQRVTICELTGHACAWLKGCHDDMASMTRAAFIWRNGECYCWDEKVENWFPTVCPPPEDGCCGANAALGSSAGGTASGGSAVAQILPRVRGLKPAAGNVVRISLTPPDGASSAAVELQLPRGVKIASISDGGAWDAVHQKLKWGPFFEPASQTVSVAVFGLGSPRVFSSERRGSSATQSKLHGAVSFDGVNVPISFE